MTSDRLQMVASEIYDDGVVLSLEWAQKRYGLTDDEMSEVMRILEGLE